VTGKGVLLQGVLAALGLGAVYSTWQREPDRAPGEATVLNLGKKDLQGIHYDDEQTTVDLFAQGQTPDGAPDVWVKVLEKKAPPKAPAAPDNNPAPVAKEFRGDESARRMWADFTPWHSPRAFGALDSAKAKELGIDDASAKKKLSVSASGQTFSFVLGQPAAHGSGETYLRDLQNGHVYLATRQLVGDLQGAAHRLVDRHLFSFKQGDFDKLTVSANGKTRALVVVNRLDPAALKLAPASAPDKPEDMLKTWHDKVWRLSPVEVLGKGAEPSERTPKVDLRIEYFDRAKSLGWLEIAHVEKPELVSSAPAKAPTSGTAGNSILFARSSHTAGWVRLPSDPVLLTDGEKVASGS